MWKSCGVGEFWRGGVTVFGSCSNGGFSALGQLHCSLSWCGEVAVMYSCQVRQLKCEGGAV